MLARVCLFLLVVRTSPVNAIAVGAVTSAGWLSSEAFNVIVSRHRPDPTALADPMVPEFGTDSFPSGHTALAVSLAAALYLPARGTRWERFTLFEGLMVALAVAASHVYLGVHYPSDVAASFLILRRWDPAPRRVVEPPRSAPAGPRQHPPVLRTCPALRRNITGSSTVREWASMDTTTGQLPGPRVLLVEDDPQLGPLIVELLAPDFAVELASNGRTGLHQGLTGAWEAMIIDRGLPLLDGLELIRALRQARHRSGADPDRAGIRRGYSSPAWTPVQTTIWPSP